MNNITFTIIGIIFIFSINSFAYGKVVVIPLNTTAKVVNKKLQNVVIVSKSGGDFSDPVIANDSITDASASNPYLIYIGPGVYVLTETLVMKEHVSIAGAGQNVTKISGNISTESDDASSAVISGVDNTNLSDLTVENMGTRKYSIAIYNNNSSPYIYNISANATGGENNIGIYNFDQSTPVIKNVNANAEKGSNNIGIKNLATGNLIMENVTAIASEGTNNSGVVNIWPSAIMFNVIARASEGTGINYGVHNYQASPRMTNVIADAAGGTESYGVYNDDICSPRMINVTATAYGGDNSWGVYNSNSSPTMTDVIAKASGITEGYGISNNVDFCYGVQNDNASSPIMTNVSATASEGATNYGVHNEGSSSPLMRNVTASASGGSNNVGVYISGGTTRVMRSSIVGGVSVTSGTLTCMHSDNGVDMPLNPDCTEMAP